MRLAKPITVVLMVAASLAIGASPSAASDTCDPTWVGNINNGAIWFARPPVNDETGGTTGYVKFEEYDEILTVVDTESNGERIWAQLYDCLQDRTFYYDSGPNEGPTDKERYDLKKREGLSLILVACEGSPVGNCGSWVGLNA